MSINVCDLCYSLVVSQCSNSYTLPITLIPSTAYNMWVEDMHGNIFQYSSTTNGTGKFTLITTEFPQGMFNQWSGTYEVTFNYSLDNQTYEPFTIDGGTYQCMLLSFANKEAVN